ncbi:hypothetical protein NUW58_g5004 [Xylaria curta]|uniref:Uncharacterized protein n=1 Tax=Xylaria curta TaxID=42375 RepID=A0ACC1P3R3_9PEZI|nr:hypothetical protein NUW58_g5004 [Xylaria curta]
MVSSVDGREPEPSPMSASSTEVPSKASDPYGHERNLDGNFDSHENWPPTTPTSARTSNGFDTDLESAKPPRISQQATRPMCGNQLVSDNRVWPGQAYWKKKALAAERKNRSCQCLARLDKRTRIILQIVTVLFVVGVAVGVGFGISISLGARTWPQDGRG